MNISLKILNGTNTQTIHIMLHEFLPSKSQKTNSATIATKMFEIYIRPKLKYNT